MKGRVTHVALLMTVLVKGGSFINCVFNFMGGITGQSKGKFQFNYTNVGTMIFDS